MARAPVWLFAAWTAALLVLPACERPPPATGAGSGGTERALRRGNGGDPGTLDPARAEDVHAFNVLAELCEGLVAYDADGQLVAGAAARWDVSADGLTYTFALRPEARWSDGAPLVAADFAAGWRRTLEPATASPYAFLLYPIRNAAAVNAGSAPAAALAVSSPDAHTLVVELGTAAPQFLAVLAMPVACPDRAAGGGSDTRFRDPAAYVGNGPYVLERWDPGQRVVVRRNPAYREADRVAIERVEFLAVEDPLTELNMYRSGELDVTATVPGAQFGALRAERPDELQVAPALGVYYLAFDLGEPPFDDPRLRQALSMAVDRERLVEILGRGEAPAYGFVPGGVAGYAAARYGWADLPGREREAEARRLYDAAGHPAGTPLAATLLYDAGDDVHETVALAVTAMWRDVLGADVRLDRREWKYFLATREQRSEWDLMRFAWSGDYNHPYTFLEILLSDSPQNLPGYASTAYDARIAAAAAAAGPAEQLRRYAEAEALMLADYPLVPLYFFVSKHLVSPAVGGYRPNVLDRHPSGSLRLAGRAGGPPGAPDR